MMTLVSSVAPAPPATLHALHIGMNWLPERPGGGLDRMVHGLMTHLPEAGVATRGLVTGRPAIDDHTVRAFARPEAPLPQRLWAVRQAFQAAAAHHSPDVVAAHFALYAAPLLPSLQAPLVMHFHGPWAAEAQAEGEGTWGVAFKRRIEQMVYRRAAAFIVLSDAFRDVLHTSYGVPYPRIHVVPGGVAADQFAVDGPPRAARHRLGWPTDRPIVLSVRRLAHRMGLERLIDAVEHVRTRVPDVLVYIAGKGPLQQVLEARIAARGLSDHIRLLGFVPDADLPYAYRAATLSVVPTVSLEGFGLITVESMAAGTPVLVTPVGGLPETVRGLDPGLVLPDASTGALADGLAHALQHPHLLPTAAACQQHVRRTFDWPVIARRTRSVYEQVLSS
ncbi:glycosyltransferase family 4 protein [Salisaeta longa]|uniref:glycosyltransferase family 4 protein n=1 Tax=Salisaeta longa TaxID=503170 RepID=UPI000688F479|nr:glycosyltransferase family 4 protein [Salisaeta longa]